MSNPLIEHVALKLWPLKLFIVFWSFGFRLSRIMLPVSPQLTEMVQLASLWTTTDRPLLAADDICRTPAAETKRRSARWHLLTGLGNRGRAG